MATPKDVFDTIYAQLCSACEVGDVTFYRMMGEYVLYYRGRVFGDICEGRLLVKQTEASNRLLPDAPKQIPYEGSRQLMLWVQHPEDASLMRRLLEEMYPQLPEPKPKKRRSAK